MIMVLSRLLRSTNQRFRLTRWAPLTRGAVTILLLLFLLLLLPLALAQGKVYVVEKNDTLSEIARANNISTRALARANGLEDTDLLLPGQRLRIPQRTTDYTVQKGDSLATIAEKHGVSVEALVEINDLNNPDKIRVGQKLAIPGASVARRYVVKKGDFLSEIARRYHVPIRRLARYNGLEQPDKLNIGQTLFIPKGKRNRPKIPSLRSGVRQSLEQIRVKPERWKYIVIHHTAKRMGTPEGIDYYHRHERHMEHGFAYHFLIGNGNGMRDGSIFVSHRWRRQIHGGHLASHRLNNISIGIALIGNFTEHNPTPKQMRSLAALTHYLIEKCHIRPADLQSHREINPEPTRCPGDHFSMGGLMSRLGYE